MSRSARKPAGIEIRHQHWCPAREDGGCSCKPKYRAIVSTPDGKLQRSFPTLAAAKQWRQDAQVDLRRGALVTRSVKTVRAAGDEWLEGARAGTARNRSGAQYKPSVIRSYEHGLREHINPAVGGARMSELRRQEVQRLVDDLVKRGLSASSVRNALVPLRVICRRALARGGIAVNPTHGLELPANRNRRDRIVDPREAAELLALLPETDRALWATAIYAGLRRGELQALRWDDVDLGDGLIRIERSWDAYEGEVSPKSEAGRRRVPIPSDLRSELERHRLRKPRHRLVFGRSDEKAFSAKAIGSRAQRLWRAAGFEPVGLHQCRHTYASYMIAAGVNIKALQTFMGHASITITLDRYGHLLPGSESQAAELLDAYLAAERSGSDA